MKERVCYYSKGDLLLRVNLLLAEKCIDGFKNGIIPANLEGIIELYHVKKLFDNDCRLPKWSEDRFNQLKTVTSGFNAIIAQYFRTSKPSNMVNEYNLLEYRYCKTFWEIIDNFTLKILFDSTAIKSMISSDVNVILHCKGVVDKYGKIIRDILLKSNLSAEIILRKYVEKKSSFTNDEIYLPTCLTLQDKENIIIRYLESEHPNMFFVSLVIQSKNNKQFFLSSHTRLKAKKIAKKGSDEMFKDSKPFEMYSVEFVQDIKPKEININADGIPKIKYGIPFIKACDNIHRVTNCISLFEWMNQFSLLSLINKSKENWPLEHFMKDNGRDSYPNNMMFHQKNKLACYQSVLYSKILESLGSSYENELKKFYNEYLKKEFNYPGREIDFPSLTYPWLNKCKIIFPELEAIVKQYNTFVEKDEIDLDIICNEPSLNTTDGKSFLEKKYYEIKEGEPEILRVLNDLFAPSSNLFYVKPYIVNPYNSLIEWLEFDVVDYDYCEGDQKTEIDYLISLDIISLNAKGYVVIKDRSRVEVLESLWENEVCSYWHYNEKERAVLDDMLSKGWLVTDDHLLSKPERDYFSYFLDNRKFTNGYAYRNNYAHGNTSPNVNDSTHALAYQVFLRLLTILILKIDDDLKLARKVSLLGVVNSKNGPIRKSV